MAEEPLLPGRSYLLKLGTAHRLGAASRASSTRSTSTRFEQLGGQDAGAQRGRLRQRRPGRADRLRPLSRQPRHRRLHPDRPLHQRHGRRRHDRLRRCAARPTSIWQALDVDKDARAALKGQKPAVLWFTGLSGAGKSTIANLVEQQAARARPPHLSCSTATMSATGSTAISASPTPTGWRTSAARPRRPSCSSMPG